MNVDIAVLDSLIRGKNEIVIIPLNAVYIDERSRDGTWCCAPYPNHPKGCPNFGKRDSCPPRAAKFEDIVDINKPLFAAIVRFDLKEHAQKMFERHKEKHKDEESYKSMPRGMQRNVLYWQNTVRKQLKRIAYNVKGLLDDYIVLEIPEANGVNVFKTMAAHGLKMKTDPDIVYKVMLICKKK